MNRRDVIITLIGKGQARIGEAFIHRGPGSKCEGCEYSKVCIDNVEPGRIYEIVGVRDRMIFCRRYEIEMQVVEVVNAKIKAAIPSRQAVPGAIITFRASTCDMESCEYRSLCFPVGLFPNDRCEVLEVTRTLPCPLGFSLKEALLRLV